MPKQVSFVGRKDEIRQIEDLIRKTDGSAVLCVSGEGGIGKTRLLQEIHKRWHDEKVEGYPLLVAEIVDFDDPSIQSRGSFRRRISQVLGERHFGPYLNRIIDWRKMEQAGVSPERLREENKAIHEAFTGCYNSLSSKSRVVLSFDTTDKLDEGEEVWAYLKRLALEIENTVLLIAGRNAHRLSEALSSDLGPVVKLMKLSSLDPASSEAYLKEKQEIILRKLEPELAHRLLVLAQGRPIIIDLAVEWIGRDIPLDWLLDSKVEELEDLSDEQLKEFESNLVQHVAQGRSPIDPLILAMSHVYPMDEEILARVLELSSQDAEDVFSRAQGHVFIKQLPDHRISLHDEMRRMVNSHVWPTIDPDGGRRRRYSQTVAEYFEEQVKQLEEEIEALPSIYEAEYDVLIELDDLIRKKDTTTLLWLEHTLISDQDAGLALYETLVQNARRQLRIRFARKLEATVEPFLDQFDNDQTYHFTVVRCQLLNDDGKFEQAKNKLLKLLNQQEGILQREARLYNALAVSEVGLGELDLALDHQKLCLRINAELGQTEYIPPVANHIGYIHRLRGELSEAAAYYEKSLGALVESDAPDRDMIASVLNHLGYVRGLEGKYDEGIRFCQQAIDIWSKEKSEKDVGVGEATLGTLYRDSRNYEEAKIYLWRAINRFEEPEDSFFLARAYFGLAWSLWFEGEEGDDKQLLIEAQDAFEKSLELAEKYDHRILLPGILHQMSNVYFLLGEKGKARQVNEEAYRLSKKIHDVRYEIDSLVGKAEFDLAEGEFERIPEYAKELGENYESKGYEYPLFYGRMRRILADVAFAEGRLGNALEGYIQGIAQIRQHGGWGIYFIGRELENLQERLDALPRQEAIKWILHLQQAWSQKEPQDLYTYMISWCERQLVRAKLRS
jgi:tetratricopeptide (TPR) repeat protein